MATKKTHRVDKRNLFREEDSSRERTPQELVKISTKPSKQNGRNLSKIQHGAHALRRRYFAGLLDGRSKIGMWTRELEKDFCQHLGYESIDQMPPTMAMMVRSTVGNWLLLCSHHAGQEKHMFDLRAAENTVLRNCRELGIQPTLKPVQDLQAYIAKKDAE